ncbi:MAG: MFS transporter [Tannerellaceae bacterium]|nr:MFS transporter [Tannerellaceae bacterium]
MEIKPNKNYTLITFTICLGSSLVPLMGSSLNLALPHLNHELGLNAVSSGWVQTIYLLSTAIFQIPCARLGDMFGRKKIFIMGVCIFLLSALLCGFSTSGITLISYRFLMGIGSAMMFGSSIAILTASVPAEIRGKILGINTAVVYFSLAAGPLLGGLLTQHIGWHSIFFTAAFISLLVIAGAFLFIKEDWKSQQSQTFDFWGSLLYAAGLSTLIYGFSGLPHWHGFAIIAGGSGLLYLFSLYEKKQIQPVFNIHLFLENRVFRMSSLSALINYSATFAIAFMMSLYLQYIRGLSPQDAGLVLIMQSVVQALVSLKSGSLSDRKSPVFLATLGMGIIFVSLVGFCFLTETTSFIFIGFIFIMLGFGFGIFSSPNMNIIMGSVNKQNYSMASATTGTMRLTGQAFSMGIAMMAISVTVGSVELTPDIHTGLMKAVRITFIACSLLCLLGVYTSSVRNR